MCHCHKNVTSNICFEYKILLVVITSFIKRKHSCITVLLEKIKPLYEYVVLSLLIYELMKLILKLSKFIKGKY